MDSSSGVQGTFERPAPQSRRGSFLAKLFCFKSM